jgi:hypothetical protein
MTDELRITVLDDGSVEFIYDDRLAELVQAHGLTTTRASHVEPHPIYPGGWLADMRLSYGPVLAANGEFGNLPRADALVPVALERRYGPLVPFETREAALAAERRWLQEHRGL